MKNFTTIATCVALAACSSLTTPSIDGTWHLEADAHQVAYAKQVPIVTDIAISSNQATITLQTPPTHISHEFMPPQKTTCDYDDKGAGRFQLTCGGVAVTFSYELTRGKLHLKQVYASTGSAAMDAAMASGDALVYDRVK